MKMLRTALVGLALVSGPALAVDVDLSWSPVAVNTDGAPALITGYRIYRGNRNSAKPLLTSVSGSTLSFRDPNIPTGEVCYHITAVNANGESANSVEGCKNGTPPVSTARPSAPVLTVR